MDPIDLLSDCNHLSIGLSSYSCCINVPTEKGYDRLEKQNVSLSIHGRLYAPIQSLFNFCFNL